MATLADILRKTGYSQDGTLAAPATDSPMTKALSEHIKTLPQQLATNQAALDSAIASWNKTDFATGKPNPNYRPEAIAELTQLMPGIGGLTAWHGTPHKIVGNFDISKVGTGEGAQAYGHGMYFAENPAVATEYKNILSKPEFTKNAEGIKLRGELPRMLEDSYNELLFKNGMQQTNYNDVADIVGQRLDRQMKDALKINDMDWYNKVADMKIDLARFKEKPPPNTGNLYKVDIPDEYIPNMLDWDKPLSQQSNLVKNALLNHPEVQKYIAEGEAKRIAMNKASPARLEKLPQIANKPFDENRVSGQQIIDRLNQVIGDPKKVSQMLNELGIKGIRYLDEGSRNVPKPDIEYYAKGVEKLKELYKKQPTETNKFALDDAVQKLESVKRSQKDITSNFVVFDPSTVKILEENGKPLTRKELIEKQVKELKD